MPKSSLPLAAAALSAVAACLSACNHSPGGHAAGTASDRSVVPVVVAARPVCRLVADNPDAAVAHIRGVDGAPSIVAGGTDYWFFGDTLRDGPGGAQDVIPASVATSADFDGSDCVRLQWKKSGGTAEPLFPRHEETTAWPDGVVALDDGSLAFYMVRVQRSSPFEWHVTGVGLGLPAGTTTGVRSVETIWDENSGFGSRVAGARSPVRIGDDIVVYIRTDAGENLVAKAPLARIDQASAYRYWDGQSWKPNPSDAKPMWPRVEGVLPADNGVSVSFDERTGRWLAVYNDALMGVAARSAEQPWGPWSDARPWLDCRPLVGDSYPNCYSAEPHRELSKDPSTLYLTFSSQSPYDVTLVELRFGVAIHEWRDPDGDLRYGASAPSGNFADGGVAFYASDQPVRGLSAVVETNGTYAVDPAANAGGLFYASATGSSSAVHTAPAYRWTKDDHEALDARDRAGWQRGAVAFYVACAGMPKISC